MKKARTKKLRGGKRKLVQAPTMSESAKKSIPPQEKAKDSTATREVAPQRAARSEPTERETNNVLKVKGAAPQSLPNGTTTGDEAEGWISLIRNGGLDRKVKVKGKTGALLVR